MSTNRALRVRSLAARSFAKVNLGLKLIGRRADGFHELRTIFQTIDLCDHLTFEPRSDSRVVLDSACPGLPSGDDNLIVRAAHQVLRVGRARSGVTIHLDKQIPMGSGLGGGSSNAAVTLLALNRMFRLSLERGDLMRLASSLGADVSFFLVGGRAFGIGRGDELFPLPDNPPANLLVVCPPLVISTREAYQKASLWLTKNRPLNNMARFRLLVFEKERAFELFENDFESVLYPEYPRLRRLKQALLDSGARHAMMTGSGAAVFGVFADRAQAHQAEKKLRLSRTTSGFSAFVVRTLPRSQYLKRIFAVSN